MPRSEPARTYPEVMPPIPQVTESDVLNGTHAHLPALESLETEFVRGTNPACRFVLALMDEGKPAFGRYNFMNRYRMSQEQGDQVFDLAIAHIRSHAVSFERKVSGVGYLIDTWFAVTRDEAQAAADALSRSLN
jgi:hypothetical protein